MEHYERARIRMECVGLAHRDREGWEPKDIIAAADQLFRYVMEEQIPEAPAQDGAMCADRASTQTKQDEDPYAQTQWCIHLGKSLYLGLQEVDRTRPISLAMTKIEEALFWMEKNL